jgi:hypothetical protein
MRNFPDNCSNLGFPLHSAILCLCWIIDFAYVLLDHFPEQFPEEFSTPASDSERDPDQKAYAPSFSQSLV